MMDMITLGQYIRRAREERDFSLREFAKKLDCSAAFLSDIELGRRYPSDKVLSKIAEALGVPIQELRKHDTRLPTDDLKTLTQKDPKYAFAFRTVIDSKVSPEQLIKLAKREKKSSSKSRRHEK